MSDNVRQRYSIAAGGGQARPASGNGAKPAYAKGGFVKNPASGTGGVTHPSCPPGFSKMNRGGKC